LDTVGKSDPYCKVYIRGQSNVQSTRVVENTTTPNWNKEFTLDVLAYGIDILTIRMYDKDVAKDDKMGTLVLQVYQLPPGQTVDAWYFLTPTKHRKKPEELQIAVQVALKGAPRWTPAPFQPPIVRANIAEAKDVAKMDTVGKPDPFCVVKLANSPSTFKTSVKNNTLAPAWNETAEFIVTNP
jgi:Ca2+-dependent lipid-binding protein